MSANRQLELPEEVCAAAEKAFGEKFRTLQELVIFLLRAAVSAEAATADQEEEQIIEQRLRELGYL